MFFIDRMGRLSEREIEEYMQMMSDRYGDENYLILSVSDEELI